MDDNCIFCKILKGEIPSAKIYEDEYTYAFLDIAKDVNGHTLVIPKKHYENVMELLAIECRQFLTYQNIDEAPLNHLYTVFATLFLIGCSIKIDYKIA